ncbi:DUF3850 domain-containing protein [Listeria monocytogenes]|nr:DUF3850 domain-containing protein [Listeria monocytogenes]EAH2076571.1 DUF3850 domain-containing protein [Listeria monocytogenes]EAH2240452.1 DUF3850 domain-containing protein [Listeria monocytogenes]EAH3326545.1 DUF3850 domain-containing protein [Listeria monocytogenes]
MTVHKLKILPKFFQEKIALKKSFEIRKNDRDYKVGDTLALQEFKNGTYTGREYWEDDVVVLGTRPNEREYPF